MKARVYLDYNATTPVDQAVVDKMIPFFTEKFGNASSIWHSYGWESEEAVEDARASVAELIGAESKEIYFTSGATEAINIAVKGITNHTDSKGNHIITTKVEHKAVLDTCKDLENKGFKVSYLDVDQNGELDLQELEGIITEKTALVAVIAGNNETGIIYPIKAITKIAHKYNIPVFSDATQVVGKSHFNVNETAVDMIAFSAHKLYGPKGIGGLFIRKNAPFSISPVLTGGGHERGIRPGTLNVPGIVGFGKACQISRLQLKKEVEQLQKLRDYFESNMTEKTDCTVVGLNAKRLPNVTNIIFNGIDAGMLMRALKRIAISQGAACSSNVVEPSHVLKAMGVSDENALSSVRVSLGRYTTKADIEIAIQDILQALNFLSNTKL